MGLGYISFSSNDRLGSVIPQLQLRPARQTLAALGDLAEYAQAYTAHIARVDHIPMAKARGAEVDHLGAGYNEQTSPVGGRCKVAALFLLARCQGPFSVVGVEYVRWRAAGEAEHE